MTQKEHSYRIFMPKRVFFSFPRGTYLVLVWGIQDDFMMTLWWRHRDVMMTQKTVPSPPIYRGRSNFERQLFRKVRICWSKSPRYPGDPRYKSRGKPLRHFKHREKKQRDWTTEAQLQTSGHPYARYPPNFFCPYRPTRKRQRDFCTWNTVLCYRSQKGQARKKSNVKIFSLPNPQNCPTLSFVTGPRKEKTGIKFHCNFFLNSNPNSTMGREDALLFFLLKRVRSEEKKIMNCTRSLSDVPIA